MRHEEFRQLLVREAGHEADAAAIATAAGRLFRGFAQKLTPIIGDAGVAAVFGRSAYLSRRQQLWLPPLSGSQTDKWFTSLEASMRQQDAKVATDAALLVLVTVSDLLVSFVGESLTTHLLAGASPLESDDDTTRKIPPERL